MKDQLQWGYERLTSTQGLVFYFQPQDLKINFFSHSCWQVDQEGIGWSSTTVIYAGSLIDNEIDDQVL